MRLRALLLLVTVSLCACGNGAGHSAASGGGPDAAGCITATALPPPVNGACENGDFLYNDRACGSVVSSDGGAPLCTDEGDGLCHPRCQIDSDCKDPCRPYCRTIGLYNGGDFNCGSVVRVCKSEDSNACQR